VAKAAKKPEPKPEDVVEIIDDVEQGTEEWHRLRIGIPTASNFATIMATGKDGGASVTRRKLMNRMAGEIWTETPAETYKNAAMARGNEMEAEARDWYGRRHLANIAKVGFVRRTIRRGLHPDLIVGCSPDALIDDDRVLEIKTEMPENMIERWERGAAGFPSEHKAQCQGTLWVTGRSSLDLVIFYRGMPFTLSYRIERDEAYIAQIAAAVETFSYELRKLVERGRKK